MNNLPWLSAHIYYSEPFEKLLIMGMKPILEQLQKTKEIKGYFFIRYWERGPHIRLRIQADTKMLEEQIKPFLLRTFQEFMKIHPSERKESVWKKLSISQRWYPNNSVQFIQYEPEITRYGGEYCIDIAEKHFQYSSDTVLKILALEKDWSYDRALGVAIQLYLSFSHAIGLNISQTISFFSRVYASWIPRAYQLIPATEGQEETVRMEKLLIAFKSTYEKQKNTLVPFMISFWKQLENKQRFDADWLTEWITKMKETDEKLIEKQKEGKLKPPFQVQMQNITNLDSKKLLERWSVYYSFIHMTNNRLGILNHDEGYLGFLLKEGLKHVSK